jgi:homoserine kinase
MKNKVRVRVPGTTANVGPGFDCLGIALNLYNTVELKLTSIPEIRLAGPKGAQPSPGAMKMVMESARAFFKKAETPELGFEINIQGDVPIARGLGSSVTVRLGIVAGLNELHGKPLTKTEVGHLVSSLEGHADNAIPALVGGFTVAGLLKDQVYWFRKKISKKLKFVAVIPDYEVVTKKARELLPPTLSFSDSVQNVNRVSLLVAALMEEDYEAVGNFLEDRLHQPYRAQLVPQLFPCLNAAKLAGAIGGWLSGSGSTIMAITLSNPKKVGQAMQKIFKDQRMSCEVVVLEADSEGLKIGGKS